MAESKLTRTISYKEYLEFQKKKINDKISSINSTSNSTNPKVTPFSVNVSVDPSATDITDPSSLKIDITGYPVRSIMGNLLEGDAWVPIPPGATVSVPPGAKLYLPLGSTTVLTSADGVDTVVRGRGVLTPIEFAAGGSFTAPVVDVTQLELENPTSSDASYPVILTIDRIIVIEDGAGYNPDDKVIITPSNGASAKINITSFGRISSITVTNGGTAFDEIPEITIESETGLGAVLRPVFKINRLKDLNEEELKIIEETVPKDKIINVVDCVGKVL